jgi:MFS family permease
MSIFFSAATAAGAFGGLLARAIIEMDHTAGLRAWQWIFILEGIATFVVGKKHFSLHILQEDTESFSSRYRLFRHVRLPSHCQISYPAREG